MKAEPKITKADRTRAAIAEAARLLFVEQGYDATTVRQIAAAAHIDPALVIRYFGSKEDLFSRIAELNLQLPDLSRTERGRLGITLVSHFLDLWEGSGSGTGMPILLRSAASNEYAAQRLRQLFIEQVLPVISAAGPKNNAHLRAGLVSSQLLGLALTRYVLKLPPVVAMDKKFIVETVGVTIQRYATLKTSKV